MSAINDLINQIENEELRERIQAEVDKLAKRKKFGLVFEEHLPECTPLYDIPVRRGAKVALKQGEVNDFYEVLTIDGDQAVCLKKGESEAVKINTDELVTIAEFGDPIYPYLKPIDTVCNAPDSDLWHTLIEADNYHALQLLEYLYAGKVDCIYIDPPYNKEDSKDWKYNCNYVDSNDNYRHSKWLSMMEKRLKLAKKLLNPSCSFLIVTIDEEEYLHLGCLLEEIFINAKMQMVCSKIKNGTSMRMTEFSRCNEYIFFLRFGKAIIEKEIPENASTSIPWRPLMRSGTGSNNFRPARPNSFYPIFIDLATKRVRGIGESLLPLALHPDDVKVPEGCYALWPLDSEQRERVWGVSRNTLADYLEHGYAKITHNRGKFGISYITTGVLNEISNGTLIVTGKDDAGGIVGYYEEGKSQMPQNQWDISTHNATDYGTTLLKNIIGNRFSFPKSVYAVEDCLKYAVRNKDDALIIDFFAGSGTTLHAVNLLNAEDGGHRRCILVTNNEMKKDEEDALLKKGIKRGSDDWNALGIARYVTWPRTVCSIEGHDVNGNPLKGNYIGSNIPMADGFKANAAYFKLGFLDKNSVALGRQFKEMLPTLWMKAGAIGRCPELHDSEIQNVMLYPENKFAILTEETAFSELKFALSECSEIETVYIITDYEPGYRSMAKSLNVKQTYQLYRDYLDNFRINIARD